MNQKPVRLLMRGLGNMASEIIVIAKKYFPNLCLIPHLIVRAREGHSTLRNLPHLTKYLPETQVLVIGDENALETVRKIHPNVALLSDTTLQAGDYDLVVDCCNDARPTIMMVANRLPLIIHAQQVEAGPCRLLVPPIWGQKPQEHSTVLKVVDCQLSGTIPLVASLLSVIDGFHGVHFITHLREGKAEDIPQRAHYYTDWLAKRKTVDFSEILRADCPVSFTCVPNRGAFYSATFSCELNLQNVEMIYGSMLNFENWGLELLLESNTRVVTSHDEDDTAHLIPRIYNYADEMEEHLERYLPKPPIVFFKRTFTRKNSKCAFTIGYNTTFLPGLAVVDILTMFHEFGCIPSQPNYIADCMKRVDSVLFNKSERKAFRDKKMFPKDTIGGVMNTNLLTSEAYHGLKES